MFQDQNLPKSIKVENKNFNIRTDFRTWIDVELILNDDLIPPQFKLFVMANNLDLFYGNDEIFNYDMGTVLNGVFSFWRMNQEPSNTSKSSHTTDIAYDYEVDYGLITAAFMQQYRINLQETNFHWFTYKSLFDGLTDATQFVKIVGYRTIDLNKVPKEERKRYQELKEMYRIDKTKTTRRRRSQKEIEAELLAK